MPSLNITIDDSSLKDLRKLLTPGEIRTALQFAVSSTVKTGKSLISKRIREEVRLLKRDVDPTITDKRGSLQDPSGSITIIRDKAFWLSRFANASKAKVMPKGGITVKVRKKATPKYPTSEKHPHAFWAVTPHSSHIGIFERTGVKRAMKSGRYKGKVKEVIRRKRGPTPINVFINARGEGGAATVFQEVGNTLADVLQKRFLSKVDFVLSKRGVVDKVSDLVRKAESLGE